MATVTGPVEDISAAGAAATLADAQKRTQLVVARIERIPASSWHMKARLIVGTATFFDAFDALTIAYILPVLVPLWQLKPGQIGNLISTGYIGQIAGALFFGWLAERRGRMSALQWSVVVMSLFSLLCAAAQDYNSLFVFRLLQGVGLGGEVPVAAAYINEIFKAKGRGRFVVLYEYVFGLGIFIASLLGYLLVPRLGWESMFILGALPALAIIFMRRHLPESPRWLATHGRLDEAEEILTRVETDATRGGKVELPPIVLGPAMVAKKTHVMELLEGRYLRRTLTVWVMWFGSYFLTYGLTTWFPTLWTTVYKLSVSDSLFWTMITRLLSLLLSLGIAWYFDIVGRKVWFTGGLLVAAAAMLVLWLMGPATPFFTVLVLTTIASSGTGILNAALYLYNPELYPTRLRALGTSIGTAWLRVASVAGPIVTGYIMATSSLNTAWLVFGLVVLAAGIITWVFSVETRARVLEEVSP
jgi:putative MFS transporter